MSSTESLLRVVLIVLLALLLLPVLMMLLFAPMMGAAGWGHMWGVEGATGGTWAMVLMWLLPLLLLLGLGYLIYSMLTGTPRHDQAIEELRAAYARGDLTSEEFEERRERLQQER
jgi:putative membrane protein